LAYESYSSGTQIPITALKLPARLQIVEFYIQVQYVTLNPSLYTKLMGTLQSGAFVNAGCKMPYSRIHLTVQPLPARQTFYRVLLSNSNEIIPRVFFIFLTEAQDDTYSHKCFRSILTQYNEIYMTVNGRVLPVEGKWHFGSDNKNVLDPLRCYDEYLKIFHSWCPANHNATPPVTFEMFKSFYTCVVFDMRAAKNLSFGYEETPHVGECVLFLRGPLLDRELELCVARQYHSNLLVNANMAVALDSSNGGQNYTSVSMH
jgi:hypothetical protein